jgi:polar amino acid transport system permease protein
LIRTFDHVDILYLLAALRWTFVLSAVSFSGAALIGLLIAVLRLLPIKPLHWLVIAYVQLVQGTPLLVWLFLLYFGTAMLGWNLDAWTSAAIAFSVYSGAFLGEVWRGALVSVPKVQWEAGASLGLSFLQQLRFVIIQQSIRIAIPPTVGFIVQLIKNTSLASTIGIVELTREGQLISASTFQPLVVYSTVAVLYFVICFPLTQTSRILERKLNAHS